MKRPFKEDRPVGPFMQRDSGSCNLMIGFPVEVSAAPMDIENPINEIEKDLVRDLNVNRADIKSDRVNLSGFDAPVVFFMSMPIRSENEATTARNMEQVLNTVEEAVEEYTNKPFAANVSVWAGDKRSGKEIR